MTEMIAIRRVPGVDASMTLTDSRDELIAVVAMDGASDRPTERSSDRALAISAAHARARGETLWLTDPDGVSRRVEPAIHVDAGVCRAATLAGRAPGSVDVDVVVLCGDREFRGTATLSPRATDGRLDQAGAAPESWLSADLIAAVHRLSQVGRAEAIHRIKGAALDAATP